MADENKKVKVSIQALPAGELIDVPGLGLFENRKTTNVTDEQVTFWENNTAFGERSWPSDGTLVLDDEVREPKPLPSTVPGEEPVAVDVGVEIFDDGSKLATTSTGKEAVFEPPQGEAPKKGRTK